MAWRNDTICASGAAFAGENDNAGDRPYRGVNTSFGLISNKAIRCSRWHRALARRAVALEAKDKSCTDVVPSVK